MKSSYDKYYQTENLFGKPYPELIEFLDAYPCKGRVLDLGCGQGRDAVAIARLGYTVIGVDISRVGIDQVNRRARAENLPLTGIVEDIYAYDQFDAFDIVLLDSMFHFAKRDKTKEVGLIRNILSKIRKGCIVIVCIQDTGKKVEILNKAIDHERVYTRLADTPFLYTYHDAESGNTSAFRYRMIAVEK